MGRYSCIHTAQYPDRPTQIPYHGYRTQHKSVLVSVSVQYEHLHTILCSPFLPTAREGNVFTGVGLSTIGLIDTGSLLGLVTARSVRILLECFLVIGVYIGQSEHTITQFVFVKV